MVQDPRILVYSFYRDAELRGARLLLALTRLMHDPDAQAKLTRHLADETRHALLWSERIAQLGGTPIEVADGYQRRLHAKIGVPTDLVEIFALTLITEERAQSRYLAHAAMKDVDPVTAELLADVARDEEWHLQWITAKLNQLATQRDDNARLARTLERYRTLEREVYSEIEEHEHELLRQ
ncbi:MAG TPA: ferritin-like domain-containing protein [Candidatus Binataceae bacterium]|nr:ferritin-like domain-containing protein [Candidatus Binataceae bacterium]